MKILVTIALLFVGFATFGQRNYIHGVVRDSASRQDMIGAHIRNINAGLLTSTDPYGKFKIPAISGDTLIISSVGHKSLSWVVKERWWEEERVEFLLPVNTIYLEEVVVGEFPEYERFKEQILNTEVEDTTFEVYGVPRVVMDPYPVLEKKEYLNPFFVMAHPLSALHHSVSKKEKEKRMMQQIKRGKYTTEKAQLKFTREWVSENTKLEGEKLTSFIAYCDFSTEYLAKTPSYVIYEDMMALLPKFLEEHDKS